MGFCGCSMFCCALLCVHLDGEERACCFALFVFLVPRDCCVALSDDAKGFLQFVFVVFPHHTHLLFSNRHGYSVSMTLYAWRLK